MACVCVRLRQTDRKTVGGQSSSSSTENSIIMEGGHSAAKEGGTFALRGKRLGQDSFHAPRQGCWHQCIK